MVGSDVERIPLIDLGARIGFTAHVGGIVTTERLLARCGVRPGLRVLEVGCGTGRTAAHLARTGRCAVVASDAHPRMLDWARQHVAAREVADQVEVVHADVRDLPWEDGAFDRVIAESVLAFVPERETAVREMVRVTRPGGLVGLNEATIVRRPVPADLDDFAQRSLIGMTLQGPEAWTGLLRDAGLRGVSAEVRGIHLRDELRSLVTWVGPREVTGPLRRTLRLYRDEPDLRDLIVSRHAAPRAAYRHLGAGVYVGEVGAE